MRRTALASAVSVGKPRPQNRTQGSSITAARIVAGGAISANGHGNARSVATIQAAVSNGGRVGDVSLFDAATIEAIFEEQARGVDMVLGTPVRFGLVYNLANPDDAHGITSGMVCYWGGWGGSIVINDLDNHITMAYMMNRMQDGLVGNQTSAALIDALLAITV